MARADSSGSRPRPWRALATLTVIILVMLISVTGKDTFRPGAWHDQFRVRLGLDLSGGTEVVLQAEAPHGQPPQAAEMNQARSILEARVNGSGSTGAQVQQQGTSLINVSLPGAGSQQAIALVSSTAQMRFRQVLLFEPYTGPATASKATPYGDTGRVNAATMQLFRKLVCTPGKNGNADTRWQGTVGYTDQQAQWDDVGSQIVSCDATGNKYVLDTAVFKGTDVTGVTAAPLQSTTQWAVTMTLDGAASQAFDTLTTTQYNDYYPNAGTNQNDAVLDQVAMVLDGNVVSAPQIHTVIPDGQVQITGPSNSPFTQEQATQLANQLKYGALPLSFKQLYVTSISAQLAHDSLNAGLIAGVLGLALVVAYMFAYYRGLGLVAVGGLLIAALLSYVSVVLLSAHQNYTLELSGIAGLIVAIGITADSFIVFFERIRDEVREGKSLRPAVEGGWKRARRTILVSDTVSFLAAILLYHFAMSDVQGFAYTLGLTTLIDVTVVFLFTKPMVTLLAGTRFYGGGHPWSGLDPRRLGARVPWRSAAPGRRPLTSRLGQLGGRLYRGEFSVNFVGRRRMWYAISGLIVVISVAGLLVRGLNFSVEFRGGALFQFPAPAATSGEISRAVSSAGIGQSTIQQLGLHHIWQVQTQTLTNAQASAVENALHHAFGVPLNSISPQLVGPTWGSDVTSKAAEALIIFLVVIVLYLSVAFERKMAVAALIALLHDIMIAVGVYALVGFQVSPTTVIGLLTILGYSLYDTVVVFDKVRENTAGLLTSGRSTYGQAANLALNQTLVRSLNTSLTALVPVASILFVGSGLLGAGTLNDLSLVLFIGMLSGAYSSIFIATPVLVSMKEREPRYQDLAKRVTRRQVSGAGAGSGARAGAAAKARRHLFSRTAGGTTGRDRTSPAREAFPRPGRPGLDYRARSI